MELLERILETLRLEANTESCALIEERLKLTKENLLLDIKQAEKRAYAYAASLEVGRERTEAFDIYENLRNATRLR